MDTLISPRRHTWLDLEGRGAAVEVSPTLVVSVRAPADVAPDLRAALAWRVEAMRAQVRGSAALGATPPTALAVPDLKLPLGEACTWRGYVEMRGNPVWQERSAQRPLHGLCGSCGDVYGGTGDCTLCNAARVAALRAEGLLPMRAAFVPPPLQDFATWRAAHYAAIARPDPNAPADAEVAFW
jgi:hypothetical protein